MKSISTKVSDIFIVENGEVEDTAEVLLGQTPEDIVGPMVETLVC